MNEYFDDTKWTPLPRNQSARAEAVNAIIEAIVVGFDSVPSASAAATDSVTYCIDTGTANAYAIAPTAPIIAYAAGMRFSFKAVNANTTASTVNVSGIGVAAIKRQDGNDLAPNDITVGRLVWIQYDGANFQLMSLAGSDVVATAASAAAAAASQVAAAESETNAANSATAAAGSATSASASATAAAASASKITVASGKALTISNTMTLAGTDGSTYTLPGSSATLARTDAANSFTGHQTFEGVTATGATGSGKMVFDTSPTLGNPTLNSPAMNGSLTLTGGAGTNSITNPSAIESEVIIAVTGTGTGNNKHFFFDFGSNSSNNSATCYQIGQNTDTSRSISAGGTINASGADYAEYETKAAACGTVAKGQIIGFDADGQVTDKFAAALSFGIKSTDPSYVGGDVWGNEAALGAPKPQPPAAPADDASDIILAAYDAAVADYVTAKAAHDALLEAARLTVDRIAYSGKVPVNVIGAAVGDYIVAAADGDGIAGQIVTAATFDSPTFDQASKVVGRVRRLLDDGRCVVAVIVH